MSDSLESHIISINVGALTNASRPLFRFPSLSGAVTVIGAHVVTDGTTAASLRLVKGAVSGGTFTANGTLDSAAIGGTASVWAANIAKSFTISNGVVEAGEWLALKEGNVQVAPTVTIVDVEYVIGREAS